jgi:uncharacterized protein (TIGR03437 family)
MRDAFVFRRTPLVLLSTWAALQSQPFSPLNCIATAVPALVRVEGLTERVGDIVLNCSGGTPGGLVRGDIRVISFGGNITNKLNAASNSLDAVLTVNTGGGEMSTGATAVPRANNQFDFAGLNFNLGSSGVATFRITNVRVVPPQTPEQPFQLALATNGPSAIRIDNSPLTVGIATRGLLASYSSTFVCTVSGIPTELTFANFLNGNTRFASTRFTEGFSEAFQRRLPPSDHGTRLMARFSGFPAGARLFVPEALAGSTALQPTAAGDLGLTPSGGRYQPGTGGQLLLSLARGTDASGAGGSLVFTPPASGGPVDLINVVEIPLSSGSGMAVYEVVDSNTSVRESVQLPVFLGLEQRPTGGSVSASLAVSFAPVSTDALASAGPVPRFQSSAPPPDCATLGDCNSGIFPRLGVDADLLTTFDPIIGQFPQTRFVRVRNDGGGLLNWTASVQYKNGSGWLSVDPVAGVGNGTVRVDANARNLQPGLYEATLTIDAGPLAGSRSLPVRMEARNVGPGPGLPPEVTRVTHGATFEVGPLAPGTIATLFGNRLRGQSVELRVNNLSARIFFGNDTQINFEVPASLPSTGNATLVVTVDGTPSAARTFALAEASPGIFANAILNQDFSVNSAANPALSGSIIQIFASGIPVTGTKSVKIHDYTVNELLFAGPAPGFIGLQQVNARVPDTLQSITADISVCAGAICSPSRQITVRQP